MQINSKGESKRVNKQDDKFPGKGKLKFKGETVKIIDPDSAYISKETVILKGVIIYPNSYLIGKNKIGNNCQIGPNSYINGSKIGDNCKIFFSVVESSSISNDVTIGPFSHLREGTNVQSGAKIGNFVETKKTSIGKESKVGHFTYLGDAVLGEKVNIGAGTVTCNFDGQKKHRTNIKDGAFIGSSTMLIAPVTIGKNAKTGAGSVVKVDLEENSLAVGVPARPVDK